MDFSLYACREINGFSICFKTGPVPKKKNGKQAGSSLSAAAIPAKENIET